jgi:polysaccharide pyruvyl transferase WcaK-like protein
MRVFVFDPSCSDHGGAPSTNLGDLIIRRSIDEVLAEILPEADLVNVSSHQPLDPHLLRQAMQADLVLVAGTNLLSSHVLDYNQWKLSSDPSLYTDPPRLNAVLMGVGWWQYQDAPDTVTRNFYNTILHPSLPHAVRDSYTARKLARCGAPCILHTSCPTLWKLEGHDIARKQRHGKCLFCLTDYHPQPEVDDSLIELLLETYDMLFFFPQGKGDLQYAETLPAFTRAGKRIFSLPHAIDAVYKILELDKLDYVGTRLHTGALCLQYGAPSLILGIDNRSREIARDINLPVAPRGDMRAIRQWLAGGPPHGQIRLPNAEIARWKARMAAYAAEKTPR